MSADEASRLEALLTEGYAEVHRLEREVLRLQRRCDEQLARGGTPAEISATIAERRAAELKLIALRRRLAAYRRGT